MAAPLPAERPQHASSLVEALLGVHGAPTVARLADAAVTAAERGLGALYALLYLRDASGNLVGERPAMSTPSRFLLKIEQELDGDPTALSFDPAERPALGDVLEGRAAAFDGLSEVLPVSGDGDVLAGVQRRLGVASVIAAPLTWNGESMGVLVLLMPTPNPANVLSSSEALGAHVAVALHNLREEDAVRRRGEMDAVRWVYDEVRLREELSHEARRSQRHTRPLSVLLLEVVNLDNIRRRFGKFLADRLLRQVAGQLEEAMRDTDFLGAFGKDAYAAILVEADGSGAITARDRLMRGLESVSLPDVDLPDLNVEFRCSTATAPEDGETADDLLGAAEARL